MDNKPIYKTAEELGIEQWEHDGLVALVGPFSRGDIEINMRDSMCGTVGCIGGNVAAKRGGISIDRYVNYLRGDGGHSTSLTPLYYPGGATFWCDDGRCNGRVKAEHPAWRASAPQAARAIVNFLVTGDPQWDAVMASP